MTWSIMPICADGFVTAMACRHSAIAADVDGCVAVCCSVWQCVAVCCSASLTWYMMPMCADGFVTAIACSHSAIAADVDGCVAMCLLQCVAVCCSVCCSAFLIWYMMLMCADGFVTAMACRHSAIAADVDGCVAGCCSVLQCVAVRCRA